jgi:hypothetical protein
VSNLILKSPVPAYFKGIEKNFKNTVFPVIKIQNFYTLQQKVFCISCTKKCNGYVYLEPDTTIGNYEAGISKFVVTISPPQFTHCAEIRLLRRCL